MSREEDIIKCRALISKTTEIAKRQNIEPFIYMTSLLSEFMSFAYVGKEFTKEKFMHDMSLIWETCEKEYNRAIKEFNAKPD
jgi:hypothetical protein